MLTILDPARVPPISVSLLRELFGLTQVEAEITVNLSHGQSLQEAADNPRYTAVVGGRSSRSYRPGR